MTVPNYNNYPENVGVLAMEMYFPKRVSSSSNGGLPGREGNMAI